jgi:hypothetical protein
VRQGRTLYSAAYEDGDLRVRLTTWYSSLPAEDPSWIVGFAGRTDIWRAVLDLARVPRTRTG